MEFTASPHLGPGFYVCSTPVNVVTDDGDVATVCAICLDWIQRPVLENWCPECGAPAHTECINAHCIQAHEKPFDQVKRTVAAADEPRRVDPASCAAPAESTPPASTPPAASQLRCLRQPLDPVLSPQEMNDHNLLREMLKGVEPDWQGHVLSGNCEYAEGEGDPEQ